MADVTPSEYIFKELQAVHATGLLTEQLSLEDEWQQTFFEMDQVLSSSPNARLSTSSETAENNCYTNNNGNQISQHQQEIIADSNNIADVSTTSAITTTQVSGPLSNFINFVDPVNTIANVSDNNHSIIGKNNNQNDNDNTPIHCDDDSLPINLSPSSKSISKVSKHQINKLSNSSMAISHNLFRPTKDNNNNIKLNSNRLVCPFCQRTFCKNFDLQQHMRCHTGEKPFQCIVCGRGFAQKSNVKKHMQAHKVWPDGTTINSLNGQEINHNKNSAPSSDVATNNNDEQIIRSRSNSASCSSNKANSISLQNTPNSYNLDDNYKDDDRESRTLINSTQTSINTLMPFGFCDQNNELPIDSVIASNDNRYSCSYCSFYGRTYFELKSHLTVHKREKVFKCIVSSCGQTFAGNDLQTFLEHVTNHKSELVYRCHLCSNQYHSLSELGFHQHEHNIITQTNTHQLQQQQDNQNLHHQSLLQQSSVYTSNNSSEQQRIYQKQTRSVAPKYYRCSKCMNRYTTLAALEHHNSITTHHYPCTDCDKVFPCERYLRRHLNTHATLLHVCSYCDKQFKTAAYLKMHKIVHTGEKPFQCNLCDAAFNRRDKLNRHKVTHEPFKKYKCPYKPLTGCQKEFNRPDKLKAHIMTHSGIKPHQCDECQRSFSRLTHLREHKKLHYDKRYNMNQLILDTDSSSPMHLSIDVQDSHLGNNRDDVHKYC